MRLIDADKLADEFQNKGPGSSDKVAQFTWAHALCCVIDAPTVKAITLDNLPDVKGSTDSSGSSWVSGYARGYNQCLCDILERYDNKRSS